MALAAIPKMPASFKVLLAMIGYVALILLLGRALRAWRADWSELWFLFPGESPKGNSAGGRPVPLDFRRSSRRSAVLRS
jgi:hypothetical protein